MATLLFYCGSYNTIDSFYEANKTKNGVTAFQAPRFLLTTLTNVVPELNSFASKVTDLRYMQIPSGNDSGNLKIANEINGLTNSNFTEVFRKNDDPVRTLVTIRERKDVVKEIIYFKKNSQQNSIFYLQGDFNPIQVRKMAEEQKFDQIINSLSQQYQWNLTPTPISN
ncbi:MAG: DUF4252 domain-containing protein [bacterium]